MSSLVLDTSGDGSATTALGTPRLPCFPLQVSPGSCCCSPIVPGSHCAHGCVWWAPHSAGPSAASLPLLELLLLVPECSSAARFRWHSKTRAVTEDLGYFTMEVDAKQLSPGEEGAVVRGTGQVWSPQSPCLNDMTLCPGHVDVALGNVVVALAVLGEHLVLMVSEGFSNLSDCVCPCQAVLLAQPGPRPAPCPGQGMLRLASGWVCGARGDPEAGHQSQQGGGSCGQAKGSPDLQQ